MTAFGCAFFLLAGTIRAAVIGVVTFDPGGTFTYSYSIDNTTGTFAVSAFSLAFDIPADQIDFERADEAGGGDIVVPNPDWLVFETPFSVAEAGIDVVNLFETPVAVGETLSGFSFQSSFAPVPTTSYVEYSAEGEFRTGFTVGPAIPEASTALLLYLGMGLWITRRRRSSHGSRNLRG